MEIVKLYAKYLVVYRGVFHYFSTRPKALAFIEKKRGMP